MKKRVFSLVLALVLCLGLVTPAMAVGFLTKVSTVDANGNIKYGYADSNANVIIAQQYEEAGDFRDGYANVKKNGLWGYIDTSGEEVIPIKYASVDGLFDRNTRRLAVKTPNGKWGVVDAGGDEIIPPRYDRVSVLDGRGRYLGDTGITLDSIFGTVIYSGDKWGLVGGVKDIPCNNGGAFRGDYLDAAWCTLGENGAAAIAAVDVPQANSTESAEAIWLGIKSETVNDIIELLPPSNYRLRELRLRADPDKEYGVSYSAIVGEYKGSERKYGYLVDGELKEPIEYTWEEIKEKVYGVRRGISANSTSESSGEFFAIGGVALVVGCVFLWLILKPKKKKMEESPAFETVPETEPEPPVPLEEPEAPVEEEAPAAPPVVEEVPVGPKFCSQCGKPVAPGAKFCPNCGNSLTDGEGDHEA